MLQVIFIFLSVSNNDNKIRTKLSVNRNISSFIRIPIINSRNRTVLTTTRVPTSSKKNRTVSTTTRVPISNTRNRTVPTTTRVPTSSKKNRTISTTTRVPTVNSMDETSYNIHNEPNENSKYDTSYDDIPYEPIHTIHILPPNNSFNQTLPTENNKLPPLDLCKGPMRQQMSWWQQLVLFFKKLFRFA